MTNETSVPAQMPICQTCVFQNRHEDPAVPRECGHPGPNVHDDHCANYHVLAGDHLGPRLAELYQYIDRLTDAVQEVLGIVEDYHPSEGGPGP